MMIKKARPMEPIRDLEVLDQFKDYLECWNVRNWFLFVLGINTGLRVSDLVALRVCDLRGEYLDLREQKTNKHRRIFINDSLRDNFQYYVKLERLQDCDYLFPSQKGGHVSKDRAYRIIRAVGDQLGLDAIGSHTMRKTFGYQYYKMTKDIGTLQMLLNHSNQGVTLRYIGVDQDRMDDAMRKVHL